MPGQDALAREMRDLLNEWDPIGVYQDPDDAPGDLDEYNDLNGPLLFRLRAGASADDIGEYLLTTLRRSYGLNPNPDWVLQFARRVTAWFAELPPSA